MELSPRQEQPLIAAAQVPGEHLDRVDGHDALGSAGIAVQVREVMLPASLRVHTHDDPVEPGYLRHELSYTPEFSGCPCADRRSVFSTLPIGFRGSSFTIA